MDRNRMRRYWTLFKLFAGGLVQPSNFWLSIYPRAWHDWRKIRSQYSGLSVSREELASIQNAIDSVC